MFERLDSMRSVGMNGLERFTPEHIRSGAQLFEWDLKPHEVEALVTLDLVTLYPGEEEAERADQDGPWPEKKG